MMRIGQASLIRGLLRALRTLWREWRDARRAERQRLLRSREYD